VVAERPWLAITTSSDRQAVGLVVGGRVVGRLECDNGHRPLETLAGAVTALLGVRRIDLDSIEGVLLDRGPGRLTSMRLGIATAAGLAFGRSWPIKAASSLLLLAAAASGDPRLEGGGWAVVSLPAGRSTHFGAAYRIDPAQAVPEVAVPPAVMEDPSSLVAGVGSDGTDQMPVACLGVGAEQAARDGAWPGAFRPEVDSLPSVDQLARLAEYLPSLSWSQLVPEYGRGAGARISFRSRVTRVTSAV
jgi:tRNA threonylcarbamoyl adenosine modification protein YeaZ